MEDTPANVILKKMEKKEWHYCSLICQMSYLAGTSRPDIPFSVHKCEKYSIDPKQSHEESVKRIRPYLNKTKDKCLVFTPDGKNGIECYVNADFYGSCCIEDADQVGLVLSRTRYIIKFVNFLIVWVSKIQIEIALLITES